MNKKRLLCLIVSCILMLCGCAGQRMMMGTGGTAGTYYAFGGILAQYMKNNTDYSVTAVSTAASKANIQSIGDGDYQMGFTQSDVMSYAWEGSKSFEKDGPCRDFRVMGALYAETVQLITMDDDIKSVYDLKGKSVSIGAPGSGVYFNAIDVLDAAGITLDDIYPQYQSFDDSKEALKDGQIDAAFIVAGAPTSAITELATTNGVDLIPVDGELREKIMNSCTYYAAQQIPAGTYPGQDNDIETITIMATMIVDADLDEEVVYQLTKAIFDHTEEISKEHAKGAELSPVNATSVTSVPFHKGAARYFAEKGITVETYD
ncbi:MAG: TAXI family TRAP transporter solute-binding subunit [Lachnospiraceae bacterium]|nr:TAXI family TRAP transporter solute-binding subunit [Lachnospiraceae bacterium]